jgi:hypothetical protein
MFEKIQKNSGAIISSILILVLIKQCNISSDLDKIKKDLKKQDVTINSLPNSNDLRIEGLNSEKRMIQATDRKILDVNRQNEIETEIKKLSSGK